MLTSLYRSKRSVRKPSGLLRRRSCGTNAYSHFRSLTLDPTPSRFGSWLVPKPRRNSSTSGAKFGKRSFSCSKIDIRVLSHKFGQRFPVTLLSRDEAEHGKNGLSSRRTSPTFSTRGVHDPGRRSKWTSWSKGLHYRSDVYFCSKSFRRELMRGGGWSGSVSLSCSSKIF